MKRGGGRRYYRPEDVGLLRKIRGLLYQDGYTIKGVQKLLKEGPSPDHGAEPREVKSVADELREMKADLDSVLKRARENGVVA